MWKKKHFNRNEGSDPAGRREIMQMLTSPSLQIF